LISSIEIVPADWHHDLSLWHNSRVAGLKGRVRSIMIIALARKLVIALWRYVETGRLPTGAIVTA
jgi:transposase